MADKVCNGKGRAEKMTYANKSVIFANEFAYIKYLLYLCSKIFGLL